MSEVSEKAPHREKLPQVEVFIPAGACGCTFSRWMDRVWSILLRYRGKVEYETLTNESPRADELGIGRMGVAVNSKVVAVSDLERELQKAIANKDIQNALARLKK
ncbi:MAG: hypothetical protein ACFFB3_01225 [Candidatus Hodarchaeota archaeon]